MGPIFSLRLLQDRDWLSIIAQFIAGGSVILAALIAVSAPSRKEEKEEVKKIEFYRSFLQLFKESVDAYYFQSFDIGKISENFAFLKIDLIIKSDWNAISSQRIEIVKILPIYAIKPFEKFLREYTMLTILEDNHSEQFGLNSEQIDLWKSSKKNLENVIKSLDDKLKPSRGPSIWFSRSRREKKKAEEN